MVTERERKETKAPGLLAHPLQHHLHLLPQGRLGHNACHLFNYARIYSRFLEKDDHREPHQREFVLQAYIQNDGILQWQRRNIQVSFNISSQGSLIFVCNASLTIIGERVQHLSKQHCPWSHFSALCFLPGAYAEQKQRLQAMQNLLDCCCRVTFGQLPCMYSVHIVHTSLLAYTSTQGQVQMTEHPPCRQAYTLIGCASTENRFRQSTDFTLGVHCVLDWSYH